MMLGLVATPEPREKTNQKLQLQWKWKLEWITASKTFEFQALIDPGPYSF